MSAKQTFINLSTLLWNLFWVYVCYSVCRLVFLLTNNNIYGDLQLDYIFHLFKSGLVFDSSAICYTNSLIILMFLFPLHLKERKTFYKVAHWIYFILNSICVIANMCDVVYFPFTGKRTTASVFSEFANEGAGNMANIFIDQGLEHWPVVVTGLLLIVSLWFCFKTPYKAEKPVESNSKKQLAGYYVCQLATLGFCGWLSVCMMRGGFTHAVRPITISNANQYVETPTEAGLVLNTPFALIRTIDKKPFTVPDYMPDNEAAKYYSPIHKPAKDLMAALDSNAFYKDIPLRTKDGKQMNVVVLILESFSKQHIGFYNKVKNECGEYGSKETFTPFLDSLLTNCGMTFRHSYANGRKSIEGMPSVLSSIPNFVEPFFLTPASMNRLSGMARELTENKGYSTAFFHGAERGSMGFEAFAKATGFQQNFSREEFKKDPNYNGDDDFDGTWAIWDEEFLQFSADRFSELKPPFMTAIFTASSHTPFDVPERYVGKFKKGKAPIQECVMYSDNALRQFFNKVKKMPWYENTLFVITADHVSGQVDPFYKSTLGYYCVPIIFYAPGIPELRGYDEETIVEQADIMPTVLTLLGYDKQYIAFGQDILTTPRSEKVALHWVPEFQGYEYVKGDYAVHFDCQNITAVYRFKTDPLQKTNLVSKLPKEQLTQFDREIKSYIQQYMQRMNDNKLVIK